MRKFLRIGVFFMGLGVCLAQSPSDQFYQAVRNNDLKTLGTLVKSSDVNTKDSRGGTPLMYAAAFGSLDAMKLLVAAGADVNAKNAFDATALMGCATDLDKVRFLVEKGADVNAQSKPGRTALLIASGINGGSEIVRFLLDKGAESSAADASGVTPLLEATRVDDTASMKLLLAKNVAANVKGGLNGVGAEGYTPLLNSAGAGNVEIVRMLLAKGADVNAASGPEGGRVKNGPIALGYLTPLHAAASTGGPDMVKLLLDAGAKINALDVRGMTPLMLAIGTDRADPRVVKMLLDRGADARIKSKADETAADWARKMGNPEIMRMLGVPKVQSSAAAIQAVGDSKLPSAKEAAGKSLALLQRTSSSFMTSGGCVSCHAQNLTGMAISVARANGLPVDERATADDLKAVKLQWASADQILIQGMNVPGAMDTIMYSLLQLAMAGAPADRGIDAMIHNLAWNQRKDGSWHFNAVERPPMEDGDFSRTALCIRAFVTYAPAGRKAEFDERIARAAGWLKAATPRTTEDRTMQLLGLKWAGADRRALEDRMKKLVALQRADGGWAQTPDLASDAYATGTVLFTLHELGTPVTDAAYRRGIAYLLKTQQEDGSWHVFSRAPKFQPYFQSGFPHDHDQWISAAATAWSSMALSYAASDKPLTAELR